MSMIGGFSRLPRFYKPAVSKMQMPKAYFGGYKKMPKELQERYKGLEKKIGDTGISKEDLMTLHMATTKKLDPLFSSEKLVVSDTHSVVTDKLGTQSKDSKKTNGKDLEKAKSFVGEEAVFIHFKKLPPDQLRHLESSFNAQLPNLDAATARLEKMLSLTSPKAGDKKPLIPTSSDPADLKKIHEDNCAQVARNKAFQQEIKDTLSHGATPFEKARDLEAYMYGKDGKGLERFSNQELKSLAMELWNLEAYDNIVEMMEHSTNADFVQNPVNLEFYAKAIMKGNYFNAFNVRAIAYALVDSKPVEAFALYAVIEAISKKAAKEMYLLDQEKNSGREISDKPEILEKNKNVEELYEKCFPDSLKTTKAIIDNYEDSLTMSLMFSEEAFKHSRDCRYACRALHRSLEQMNAPEVERWVALTKMSALKEGGLRSNNVAVVRSYLEALYASDPLNTAEIQLAEETLVNLFENERQITDFLSSLNDLMLPALNSEMVDKFKSRLEIAVREIQSKDPNRTKRNKEKLLSLRSEWESYTYTYKGVNSNYVEGNFRFGAQLPTHHINRHDSAFFQEVLEQPISKILKNFSHLPNHDRKLEDITDFEEFNTIVDAIIRERFHTDELDLEQLDSSGHQVFDQTVQGLNALYGGSTKEARKNMPDSRTNISTNYILGLGDCRHHSQVKQILFDKWRAHHADKIITEMFQIGPEESDTKNTRLEQLEKSCKDLLRHELRTFDLEVYLPIELANGYPVWKDGHLVKDQSGQVKKVEEHTLTVEVNYDADMAKVEDATLRDAFYQKTYPWKAQSVGDPSKLLKGGISGGSIEVLNEATGKLETVDILLRPTNYAGPKARYNRGADSAYCLGQPIEELSFQQSKSMEPEIQAHKDSVRMWFTSQTP